MLDRAKREIASQIEDVDKKLTKRQSTDLILLLQPGIIIIASSYN